MKVALATEGNMVAAHFGRCSHYTIVDLSEGKEESRSVIPNPGHRPGYLPGFLAELGVKVIIAGGMGPRAQDLFSERGISTVVGVSGSIDEAVRGYLQGTLRSGESTCEHEGPNWR